MCGQILRSLRNQFQCQVVALHGIIRPVDESVLPHDRAVGFWVVFTDFFKRKTEFKSRAHPRQPLKLRAKDRAHDLLAANTRRDSNERVRMRVIHMCVRHESVQRGVDRSSARIQIPSAVPVQVDHVVLGLRLDAIWSACRVHLLQLLQLCH